MSCGIKIAATVGCLLLALVMLIFDWRLAEREAKTEEAREFNHGVNDCFAMILTWNGLLAFALFAIWEIWGGKSV